MPGEGGACSVKCQLSDYVFLRRVRRRTIIAKTSNLHQKVGYRQDYKYRKLHAYTPKTLTVVLSLVQTRKNQLSATGTYYRKSIHRSLSVQFRVVFDTRIFERLEEDPTYIQKQSIRVQKTSEIKHWRVSFDTPPTNCPPSFRKFIRRPCVNYMPIIGTAFPIIELYR